MNNKIKSRGLFKPFATLFVACIATISLSSCGSKKDLYSGIDPDSTYVSLGNYTVTNEEMYDTFKWSASSLVSSKINEALTYSYLEDVKTTIESNEQSEKHDTYVKGVQDYLICAALEVDSADQADDINNPYLLAELKLKYQDSIYQNYNITLSTKQIEELIAREDGESAINYSELNNKQKTVFSKYYNSYAAKLFAKDYLKEDIQDYEDEMDEDDDPYYTDDEIETYWTNNYEYKYDLKAILIRFISEDEYKQVLKAFGLKENKSRFYFIKQEGVEKPNQTVDLTNEEYSSWYDDFDFADFNNQNNMLDITSFNETLMLSIYVEMYNYVYSYRTQLKNVELPEDVKTDTSNRRAVTEELINIFRTDAYSEMTYDQFYNQYLTDTTGYEVSDYLLYNGEKLDAISSSLKSYMYSTLDLSEVNSNYSLSGQNYSNSYFMSFKISDALVPEDEKLIYVDADEEELDRTKNTELIDSIIDELMNEELTESYISTALSNSKEDCKIRIYDEAIEISYSSTDSNYSKTRKKSPADGVVAQFIYDGNTVNLYAIDIWNDLEPANGVSIAVDILSRKIIKETSVYAEIKADKSLTENYYDTLNILLANFAAGQLSSYGYDSSLGKYNFLMLYFHTSDIDAIVDDFYRLSEASNKILNDYSSEALASLLKSSSDSYFDQYFSLSATNLLVYVDMDEDGEADEYFNWNDSIAKPFDDVKTYADLAKDLISNIITIVKNSTSSDAETISSIITEYNSSSRFGNGYNDAIVDGSYDPTEPEKYWAKYRANGLLIKSEDYTSITNSSDYAAVNDVLKIAMFDAYGDASYLFEDETVPAEYLVTKYYDNSNYNGLLSSYGYNLFTLTGATVNEDATFTEEDDLNGLYKELVYMYNENAYLISDLYSEDGYLSINQIRAYLLEYTTSQTTSSMPTVVSTALTTFLQPIYTRFTSETSQFAILLSYLETVVGESSIDAFKFGTSDIIVNNTERFNEIIEINKRVQDNYSITDSIVGSIYDEEFFANYEIRLTFFEDTTSALESTEKLASIENLYGNWWNDLSSYASNAFVKGE